jgi:hypothetical protein
MTTATSPRSATGVGTVDLWFDPSCPWTWSTSRWLVEEVAPHRPVAVRWHLMSLAVLNEGRDVPPQYAERTAAGRRLLRLLAAAVARHGDEALGPLYTAVGSRLHREGRDPDAALATEALAEAGLDPDLVDALDEALDGTADGEALDVAVRASHEQSQAVVGDASGSPVLALDGKGFFGPVVTPIPRGPEALELFDALAVLARTPSFSEVKRGRSGPPDAG